MMCPWTAEEITGHDDYDAMLVEADTIESISNPFIVGWYDEPPASVDVSIPPLEEERKNWFAETTVLAEVESVISDTRNLVDYLIDFEDDIEGVGEVSLRGGDSFPLCGRLEGARDFSVGIVTAEKKQSDLAVAIKSESDSDSQEVYPEIGLSICPDWVLVLERTEHVLIDSDNFILDVKIGGEVCHLGGAIVGPKFFCQWFASKFHLTLRIDEFEWGELVTHWFEMSQTREPTIVPLLVSEKLWTQFPDVEIFKAICRVLVDEGVRPGDWVAFTEIPSGHSAGGAQT